MQERMQIQAKVMQHLGVVQLVDGRTVPGARFQEIAKKFALVYRPGKSVTEIEKEIKYELTGR